MDIVEEAREFVIKEKGKYVNEFLLFEVAEQKVKELVEKLDADKTVALIGYYFMDVKRPEASSQGKSEEHVRRGVEFVKEFLKKHDLDTETNEKIINCVEAHHGDVPFICKEAEICANADSYKFLCPRGLLAFVFASGNKDRSFGKTLQMADDKLDEKLKMITLPEVKKELEPYYHQFKEIIKQAKK